MSYLVSSRHKYYNYNLFTNMLMYLSQQSEKIYLILKGKRKGKDQKQNCFPFYFCPLISSPHLCEVIKALEEEIICVKWWPKNDTKHTHTHTHHSTLSSLLGNIWPICLLLVSHSSPLTFNLSFFLRSFFLSLFLTFTFSYFLSFFLSFLLAFDTLPFYLYLYIDGSCAVVV